MIDIKEFIRIVESEFPLDRVTYQKSVPTFHPENATEAAAFMRLAAKHGRKIFIAGFGNNIEPVGEPFTNIMSVKTDRLNNILEISANDLFVTVGGGYPLLEINAHLKKDNLFVPHANLPYVGSVGGALAVGLSGEMHDHDVPLKRYLLKAEVVTAEGEIITPGSVCFKSVSGYDVVKIFAGSWGLLGLIASATLRVTPDTALDDYATLRMKEIDRKHFLTGLDENSTDQDVIYSRKIKAKFDPDGILPIV